MTRKQLLGMYWEAKRVEARRGLTFLRLMVAIKMPKIYKEISEELEQRAYPVDPEADGHFGKEDIQAVRGLMKGMVRSE